MPDTAPVPARPVYTITVSSSGDAALDGEPVQAAPGQEPRVAALAEVRVKAALHGRPVRVTAKEPDGTVWPLIVDTDGTVTTLDHPHPAPPCGQLAPTPGGTSASGWQQPLPTHYQPLFERVTAADRVGDLVAAIVAAVTLETALEREFGPHHPHTVNTLTLRAWLTLRQQPHGHETAQLLLQTATRRHEAGALPYGDTARCARNAHAVWREVARTDPGTGGALCADVLRVLELLGEAGRACDVRAWCDAALVQQGGMP
ncbi:hypothetical protein Q3V23_00175 [Streptomyces sp. VNUA116]|uniref:hypothetical protein n=1 Tax=Streptomyces sp. VNUA116 TaxID=3062449 RepID=UPI0026748B71|nr:hypothetical protein [Streptomyces sp. VNUA116]WKU42614.1 hypothetical protein Q3V23_00175 [Streptomyces sp. VNUA116]